MSDEPGPGGRRKRQAIQPREADAGFQPGPTADSIRQRALRACLPCRRRKKKCDGSFPCVTCRQFEYDCMYEPVDSRESPVTVSEEHPSSGQENGHSLKRKHEPELAEPNKLRIFDGGSSVAFPRALALALHSETAPRLHSFAYNVGIRPERVFKQEKVLMHFMSCEEAKVYARSYLKSIQIHFTLADERLLDSLRDCYDPDKVEDESSLMTEITLCFVVALGSFYSWPKSFERECELVQKAEEILDRATFNEASSLIRINHARAWILRTMYCRTTTRPNIAWLVSGTAVRVCESLGLHKEVDSLRVMAPHLPHFTPEELETRRRMFWIAWAVNHLESFNYGRSSVFVSGINAKLPCKKPGDETLNLVSVAQTLHRFTDDPLAMSPKECCLTLKELDPGDDEDVPLLAMVRTEVACGLYRRLRAFDRHLAEQSIDRLMKIGRKGLEGARHFVEVGKPWFKLVSTPFQFACTVLSIGDLKILDGVGEALSILHDIQAKFQTDLAKEAYDTARLLAQIASHAREKELAVLKKALGESPSPPEPALPQFSQEDIDWAAFLNQDYFDVHGSLLMEGVGL